MWTLVAVVITPLVWALLTSLKPDSETHRYPPTLVPHTFTLQNYVQLFKILPFATFYWNTIEVAAISSVLTILLAAMAAYAMARFRTLGTEAAGFVGLAAYMLPGILLIVPIFRACTPLISCRLAFGSCVRTSPASPARSSMQRWSMVQPGSRLSTWWFSRKLCRA